MNVVVVGATGNTGTSVVRALVDRPEVATVRCLARRLPTWQPAKTHWAAVNVAEDDLRPHFDGADVVVHLAWLFQPTRNPVTTWRTNVLGSLRVFEAAVAAGVPALVCASSVGAYSPGDGDRPVDESSPTHGWPEAAYTREKAYVERLLDLVERDHPGMRVVRLRPGFLFTRYSASEQRRLFAGPLVPHSIVRSSLIPVVPHPRGLRFQVSHTDDAADAYVRAALGSASGAFNVATDPVVDTRTLASLLDAETMSVPASIVRTTVDVAWRAHLVPASPQLFDAVMRLPVMDTSRARDLLGWSPRFDATETLREFLTGMQEAAGAETPPLRPHPGLRGRLHELRTGVGRRP
ncbi:NAD-dependent epimerase/dehydratase family protein [Allosaccharopolyspora coralli]|uniref:NAD-dependent epimerase/dehydratase family protein n=1 Tax=Allosaccharopolyspora coralli TaxID=2665642 RepID=A0A5Q3Q816_9PSEU|nr:NAD-dependent epimerase/dehydratase family protein [Allosaccharopolyspora coralli]QGK70698.1 NAD-dependent epimerase/dehydratase family protein [Allosaccharopolyspora coralli]